MKKMGWVIGTGLLAAVGLGAMSSAASAAVLNNPYGNSAVDLVIGTVSSLPTAIWRRKSDGACTTTTLGTSAGLSDSYDVHGGSGADDLEVPSGWSSHCGLSYGPVVYNGFYIDLYGNDGEDYLYSAAGDTWIWGGNQNDHLQFSNPYGQLAGGEGNDNLNSGHWTTSAASESLYGENGNDCMIDGNQAASVFDCGAGSDMRFNGAYPPNHSSCETVVSFCPAIFSAGRP